MSFLGFSQNQWGGLKSVSPIHSAWGFLDPKPLLTCSFKLEFKQACCKGKAQKSTWRDCSFQSVCQKGLVEGQ